MQRFLRPCLLLVLAQGTAHGYELLEKLTEAPFLLHPPDVGSVYRNLRALEAEGAVESTWVPGSGGPARRLYRLTSTGWRLLAEWAEVLAAQQQAIATFLAAYQELAAVQSRPETARDREDGAESDR